MASEEQPKCGSKNAATTRANFEEEPPQALAAQGPMADAQIVRCRKIKPFMSCRSSRRLYSRRVGTNHGIDLRLSPLSRRARKLMELL